MRAEPFGPPLPLGKFVLLALLGLCLTLPTSAQDASLLAFGDSISIGFREPGVDCDRPATTARGYIEHLVELLADDGWSLGWSASGVCGELTFGGVTRLDDVLAADDADVVLIMEGTNDMSRGGSNLISLEAVQDNLELMVAKVQQAGRQPVLASTIPYGSGADRQASLNNRAARLSDRLRDWAGQQDVPFADPYNFLVVIPNLFTTYYHPDGYHLTADGNERLARAFRSASLEALGNLCVPRTCEPDESTLCLMDDRFEVRVEWQAGDASGVGRMDPLPGGESGKAWFFSPENIELVVKMLDARCAAGPDDTGGAFWVFYGALSNVQYRIQVLDTQTCSERIYFNPDGELASVGDTFAFPEACPPVP